MMPQSQKKFERFVRAFFAKSDNSSDDWEIQKPFPISNDEKKEQGYSQSKFIVDGYSKKLNVVWEYDGPYHYTNTRTIQKDKERKKFFASKNISMIAFPFYCTMTEEVVRFYFYNFFKSEDAFQKVMNDNYLLALKKCYKYKEDDGTPRTKAPSPGWRGSSHTPLTFIKEWKKRFLKELKTLPSKTQNQILQTMKEHFYQEDKDVLELIYK